jgi:hypothetical protein
MSAKKQVTIDYNGQRILLDTVGGYCGIYKNDRSNNEYGVRFYLRNGETIEQLGNDEGCQKDMLDFLDKHFKPISFSANKCQVCVYSSDHRNCRNVRKCTEWDGHKGFKRVVKSA